MTKIRKKDKARLKRLSRKHNDNIIKKVRGLLLEGLRWEEAKKKAFENE